jgi:hypothetical protein
MRQRNAVRLPLALMLPVLAFSGAPASAQIAVPRASHVTIVVMENRNYDTIVGSPEAPYFNRVSRTILRSSPDRRRA